MLSQALPDEIVQPLSYVPSRAKYLEIINIFFKRDLLIVFLLRSAFVGSGSKSLANLNKRSFKDQDDDLKVLF